jgi:hypothetical protein
MKEKRKTTPVDLRRLPNDWEIIKKRVSELHNNPDLNKYLNIKITALATAYNEYPESVLAAISKCSTKRKRQHIQNEVYATLVELSNKSQVPIATIIDRLILTPLFHDGLLIVEPVRGLFIDLKALGL